MSSFASHHTQYRFIDIIISFNIVLEKAEPERDIKFIIAATTKCLSTPLPIPNLSSKIPAENSSLKNETGISFQTSTKHTHCIKQSSKR